MLQHIKNIQEKEALKGLAMNYALCMLLLLALSPHQIHPLSRTKRCIQKIKSFFNRNSVEHIDHNEFPTALLHSISIENHNGSITIKTGWKKKYLCLKTIKRAKNKTNLDSIKIIVDSTKPHHLAISTQHPCSTPSGLVEYELIIPTTLAVCLKTDKGNIYVNDIAGTIDAFTKHG